MVQVQPHYERAYTYDTWMESVGIPVHRGFYIEDLRTVPLGWWKERECNAAFIQLDGMQGVCETRVSEIPPGGTLPPFKFGMDEAVYVLQGTGLASIWRTEDPSIQRSHFGGRAPSAVGSGRADSRSFEWGPHSLFMVPRNYYFQFSNTRGDAAVRLLHYNFLPVGVSINPSPGFFFNNPYEEPVAPLTDVYAEAKAVRVGDQDSDGDPYVWFGNFFPDLNMWNRLTPYQRRGAGGHHLRIQFPNSEMHCHMSVFEPRLYKKAHRHGPGRAIVIPAGEGYSIIWQEGQEKVVIPWHECSLFTPPNRWFHQHFNVGTTGARYLALTTLRQIGGRDERVTDRSRDQIEYPDEEPWIRQKFAEELTKSGTTSLMPEEAYKDREYRWSFRGSYAAPVA